MKPLFEKKVKQVFFFVTIKKHFTIYFGLKKFKLNNLLDTNKLVQQPRDHYYLSSFRNNN
jgi:hypothetical protein